MSHCATTPAQTPELTIVATKCLALGKGKAQDIRGDDCLAFDDRKRAIDRQQHGIQERIQEIDNTGAFWQKAPSAT